MPNQETKIVCPVCGANFAIPAHQHIATGVAVGKDSNLGTVALTLDSEQPQSGRLSADDKLTALRNAGVNVANLFSMRGASGESKIVRMVNNQVVEVPDNDPIFAKIMAGGTIPNRRLFRRWVMAQAFHMLVAPGGFTEALNRKGYQYSWEMLLEELRVQAKLEVTDIENFVERNRWFNKAVAIGMAKDYLAQLKVIVKDRHVRKCQGRKYIRICHRNIFVDNVEAEVWGPLTVWYNHINEANNTAELYLAVKGFYKAVKNCYVKSSMRQAGIFKGAYKGAGAFFTLKNLILFHGCRMYVEGRALSQIGSIKKLHDKAAEYQTDGWKLFGLMKKFIEDNDIDIKAKMAGWRKRK